MARLRSSTAASLPSCVAAVRGLAPAHVELEGARAVRWAPPTSACAPLSASVAGALRAFSVGGGQRGAAGPGARPPATATGVQRAALDLVPAYLDAAGLEDQIAPGRACTSPNRATSAREPRAPPATAAVSSHASGCGTCRRRVAVDLHERRHAGRGRASATGPRPRRATAPRASRSTVANGRMSTLRGLAAASTPAVAAKREQHCGDATVRVSSDQRSHRPRPPFGSARAQARHQPAEAHRPDPPQRDLRDQQHRHQPHQPRPDVHARGATGAGSGGRRPSARSSIPPPVSSESSRSNVSSTPRSRNSCAYGTTRPASWEPTIWSARRCAMPTR